MAKKSKAEAAHYKKMQRSEKAIEERIKKDLKVDITVEELEDVIISLKGKITDLEEELKYLKNELKKSKKELEMRNYGVAPPPRYVSNESYFTYSTTNEPWAPEWESSSEPTEAQQEQLTVSDVDTATGTVTLRRG